MGLAIFLAVWIFLLMVLVLDFAGILRRGTAWRWQGTGLLAMNSAALISSYASARGWSNTRLDALHSITWPITLAGFAILVIGLVVQGRGRRRARQTKYPGEWRPLASLQADSCTAGARPPMTQEWCYWWPRSSSALPGRGRLSFLLEVVADMQPGVNDPVPLERVISGIEGFDEELAVYVPAGIPVSPGTPVYLVDEEIAEPPAGTEYVLEISLMKNVIKVWSAWRNGAVPSIPQACEAVLHYAERDAYLPVSGPEG